MPARLSDAKEENRLSATRDSLHRLVDALPERRVDAAIVLLLELAAVDEGVVIPWDRVEKALSTSLSPPSGVGEADLPVEEDAELLRQFEASLEEIRAGRPLIPHEVLARFIARPRHDG